MSKICIGVLAWLCFGLCLAPAVAADTTGACSVREAKRIMVRERAQYREALRVYEATRRYSGLYGSSVGRWTRLARRTGWGWPTLPTLMPVMYRESRGDPTASNGGVYLGLLQIWRAHVPDPERLTVPSYNLRVGLRLYRESGWGPWGGQ